MAKAPLTWRHVTILLPKGTRTFNVHDHSPHVMAYNTLAKAQIISDCDGRIYRPKSKVVERQYMFLDGAYQYYVRKEDVREVKYTGTTELINYLPLPAVAGDYEEIP